MKRGVVLCNMRVSDKTRSLYATTREGHGYSMGLTFRGVNSRFDWGPVSMSALS